MGSHLQVGYGHKSSNTSLEAMAKMWFHIAMNKGRKNENKGRNLLLKYFYFEMRLLLLAGWKEKKRNQMKPI
jgi:hypothetical protein